MDYKAIPGFDKFEINEAGEVRNAKTKRETKPYHTSDKTGPMVHLLDTKAGTEARLSVLKLVKDVFGKTVPGWDIDPDTIPVKTTVDRKPRLTDAEKQARRAAKDVKAQELARKRADAKAAKEAAKAAAKEDKNKAAADAPVKVATKKVSKKLAVTAAPEAVLA